MAVHEIQANEAEVDREIARLHQQGVDPDVAAALVPMLASADVTVYRAAHAFAARNVTGLDLSDEGRLLAARTVAAAKALVDSYRARYGSAVVQHYGQSARDRYAPSDAALQDSLDRRDLLSNRTTPTDLTAVNERRHLPESVRHHQATIIQPDLMQNIADIATESAQALDGLMLDTWARG